MSNVMFVRPKVARSEYTNDAISAANIKSIDLAEQLKADFYDNISINKHTTHPARCPGINSLKQTGWYLKTDIDITSIKDLPDRNFDIFLNYYDLPNDWTIVRYESNWLGYVKDGFRLLSIPASYQSSKWFSMPGMVEGGGAGVTTINAFIAMNKRDVIPAGTIISQFILIDKNNDKDFVIRDQTNEDYDNMKTKEMIMKSLSNDRSQYYKAIQNGLFDNPLLEEE